MRSDETNPLENKLPESIREDNFIGAIETSGYPLQGAVAGALSNTFDTVTEEWGYRDQDTGERRSLDVIAHKTLDNKSSKELEAWLALLIECKRSREPFVFFQSVAPPSMYSFPYIAGLKDDGIYVRATKDNRGQYLPGALILGLNELPFIKENPPICTSFAKATPSGKKVSLSGKTPFRSIVLPLGKAFDHATSLFNAASSNDRAIAQLTLCLGVVDAPMVLVESPDQASDPILTPWVRVVRQEASQRGSTRGWYKFYYLDVIHSSFLQTYLADHLLPFAQDFGQRAIQRREVLLKGGEVSQLDSWTWEQIRPVQSKT